jgi:molybdate transport system substrate-binding protein
MRVAAALLFAIASVRAADLLVAAAADLAPLTSELERGFGAPVKFSIGSSGSLARQIENGAPFDVFLSANDQFVTELAQQGKLDKTTVAIYALGRIAVWFPQGAGQSLDDLTKPSIKHVAIPNPQHAPYGVAARKALETRGLWKQIEPKIVYGENVRQSLQFAESGNADAVITSWTLLKGRGALLPAEWHDPIRQAGGVVTSSPQPETARRFLKFLTSPEGRKILEKDGLFPPGS